METPCPISASGLRGSDALVEPELPFGKGGPLASGYSDLTQNIGPTRTLQPGMKLYL
jgi:hypothetical protein